MRPETAAALFLMAGFFLSLCAWIWVVWPEADPTDDTAWERRRP